MQDFIEANGKQYRLFISCEKRNSISIRIGKRGIALKMPLHLDREERFREILKAKQWARKKLEENPERFNRQQREYKDGEMLKVGAEEYMLKIQFAGKASSSARIDGNSLLLSISANLPKEEQNSHISTLLSRCIASRRLPLLKEKVHNLNQQHFNMPLSKIFFKHNKSNWGSCSMQGNINISTRILFAPDDVLEYVCIHELAHLREHNHSESFWHLVEKAMPDYKEKIAWLKENGKSCVF
ncbi:MAG: M48 family metallopeptidase [Nanoarchaeota archaeon]|nr:M48 family metallopeptidase [Nanoarchaeota archaeon]